MSDDRERYHGAGLGTVHCLDCGGHHGTGLEAVHCDIRVHGVTKTRERLERFLEPHLVDSLIRRARATTRKT